MTKLPHHVQIDDHSRGRGFPLRGGGSCDHRPEHGARGVQFLDFAERFFPLFDASLLTGRGFGLGLFSIQFATYASRCAHGGAGVWVSNPLAGAGCDTDRHIHSHSAWRSLTLRSRFSGFVLPTVQGNRVKCRGYSARTLLNLQRREA